MTSNPHPPCRGTRRPQNRRGTIAVLTAFLMVPLIGMLAFSVDVGYLLKKRAELQRAADAAALAAVRDLIPDSNGDQDLDAVRATLRAYAARNVTDVNNFTVLDSDITIGRFDPETVYTDFTILNDGIFDTVRVTLRRDSSANAPIPLFFAGIFGILDSEVSASATAVLQKASILPPGSGVLPFSIPRDEWTNTELDDPPWSIYGDGKMRDGSGRSIPGNWGTLDLGSTSNSTSDINDQILNGLHQSHLDELHSDARIPHSRHINSSVPFNANADTGLSGGIKHSLNQIIGENRYIPIYDSISGSSGNNLEFHVTGWAVAKLHGTSFKGVNNSYVEIKKISTFDGLLKPNPDLSVTEGVIEGAFTSPVLVE